MSSDRIGAKPGSFSSGNGPLGPIFQIFLFVAALYAFFVSIDLMSAAFKISGKGFTQGLLGTVEDPLAGLILGFLTTSLVQSSSTTTSIVVGLFAAGSFPLGIAIPIIMGANIGTTVTNTIVSLGHITRRHEFSRAFAAGTVHDFFNILAVLVLFPIEMAFHPVELSAIFLEGLFAGAGGFQFVSPLKTIVKPASHALLEAFPHALALMLIALAVLFTSLTLMVRVMRKAVLVRVEHLFDRVLFRNDFASFLLGWILTALVQSSSATTSMVIPLAGTGVLSLRRIFPYTMGANLGTTVTALLASLATGNPMAMTVALSHLVFNVFGTVIFYPLRMIPIGLARWTGNIAGRSRTSGVTVIAAYVLLHVLPILYIVLK